MDEDSQARELERTSRSPRPLLDRALYSAKTVVARYPSIALPIARLRGHGYPFGSETEIVIEGFPRTGTSFAVSAFEMAQPTKPVIAHHVHAPAQLIAAVRAGAPALLLVREPEEAVLSLVIRAPQRGVAAALRGYVRFHEPLLRHLDGMVVATFSQVVRDFGEVMERVNRRFGTSFRPFDHTEENVRMVLAAIEAYTRPAGGGEEEFERIVGRPSHVREALKARLRGQYRLPRLDARRRRAEGLYERFAARSAG